jgi:hypothetical protein
MDKQDLYKLDEILYKDIQEQRKKKEAENKAFFDGMEKGAEMMMKRVRDFLTAEEEGKQQCPIN